MLFQLYYSQNPNHNKCPKGPNSWCSYYRDIATAKSTYRPINDPLSSAIITAIKPIFNQLGNERLLSSCENAKIQNLNESYHDLGWYLASKRLQNNQGYKTTYLECSIAS